MQRRISLAQRVFISVMVPLVSSSATFILLYTFMPRYKTLLPIITVQEPTVIRSTTVPIPYAIPIQLKIGSIGVETVVVPMGLAADGNMAIDEDPKKVAWYKLGPKPGEEGSAVIAGHYGWLNGVPSVFNDVNKLVKGDKISTIGEDGRELVFVVTRTALYAPDQDATDVFRSDDGKAHLNLITCQGTWDGSVNSYSERFVVFTELEIV